MKTVRKWVFQNVVLLIMPFVIAIVFLFIFHVKNLMESNISMAEKSMDLYLESLDGNLRAMERILLTIYDNNIDMFYLSASEDKNQFVLSEIGFRNYLSNELLVFNVFDGMFTMVDRGEEWIYIDGGVDYRNEMLHQMEKLRNENSLSDMTKSNKWFFIFGQEHVFLTRMTSNGNCLCGAYICMDDFADQLKTHCGIDESELLTLTMNGQTISVTENDFLKLKEKSIENKPLIIDGDIYIAGSSETRYAGLLTQIFIPVSVLMKNIYPFLGIGAGLVIILAGLMFWFMVKTKEKIVRPMEKISMAMENVEDNSRFIFESKALYEFDRVKKGFNEMKKRIYDLKIEKYEQELKEQRIHMNYLFGQIQPHFFLNTLNVIYSFAETEDYELIKKLTLVMVRYLRYIFNNGSKPVALKKEIAHVEDFIEIQQIRYPDKIYFEYDIEDKLENAGVLPFLLQTFVENCIKYGIDIEKKNRINIRVAKDGDMVHIIVSDTGKGFEEEALRMINADDENEEGIYRVGIRNIRQRLKIMYGESAGIVARNREEGGAAIDICYPFIQI